MDLTIKQFAQAGGVGVETVRFYQRKGLLEVPPRGPGIRRYGERDVRRLRFIRSAQSAGFTLEEIRELLALSADRQRGVKAVKQRAQQRLAAIEQRIAELQRVRDGLAQLVASCPGHGKPEDCPILRALADGEVKP